MSPISVAQYLDPKYPAFDLVVFDEASQMPTSEAVGAVARGKELTVVRAPNQLNPTSFFASNQVDEEHIEQEDSESILDDCIVLTMPQDHLQWHYRSRHESLIAFSNRMYYKNLFTFPSPNNIISQVSLKQVDGYYDRGKTRQNRAEAEAIIQEIMRRLSDPVLCKRSIGVVTFSSVQQTLIADMLDEEFSKKPELDEIANNADEPIFIKNLENVQGDERDVILFSICYGPDMQGKPSLNFGPLNREKGWRRLNVAVSRARYEMIIYSVLKPEQINLNNTRSEGVLGLKTFLEFAANGVKSLPELPGKTETSQEAVEIIAGKIRELGYTAHTNIGSSGYQVDIGIVNPKDPETYVLGILCDGENYYDGGTALDRNNTQMSVLKDLGWKIYRVWVLDWWDNPQKELDRIQESIDVAMNGEQASDTVETIDSETNDDDNQSTAAQIANFETVSECETNIDINHYNITKLSQVYGYYGDYDYFNEYGTNEIVQQITEVIAFEAPIHQEVLYRRVLEAWGISRIGSRIKRRLDGIMSRYFKNFLYRKFAGNIYYWSNDQVPGEYDNFRIPAPNDECTRRNFEHLPPEEIASAIKYIVGSQFGLSRADLERELSRIFGFARCTEQMQKCIAYGIEIAVKQQWVIIGGNRITISESITAPISPTISSKWTVSSQQSHSLTEKQREALTEAKDHLSYSNYSYDSLIEQLKDDGFSQKDSKYAADNCGADWFEHAKNVAMDNIKYSVYSRNSMIEDLKDDGFTKAQAAHGADNCNADWFEHAKNSAAEYLESSAYSHKGLIEQLEYEGFTKEQATYGTDSSDADWFEQAIKGAQEHLNASTYTRDELTGQLEYDGFTKEQALYGVKNCGKLF